VGLGALFRGTDLARENQAEEGAMLVDLLEPGDEEADELLAKPGRFVGGERPVELGEHLRTPLGAQRIEQRLAIGEAVVEGAHGDARTLGDLRHGGALEPALGEDRLGRVEDLAQARFPKPVPQALTGASSF